MLDSAGAPIVGGVDALLIAVSTERPNQAYAAALLAIVGSLAGSLFLFYIAKKGGEVLLMKHISSRRGARLHTWFQRYGLVTVFVPALSPLPMPMKVPVFCAGALQVRVIYFALVVIAARTARYFTLAYLGQHYGHDAGRYLLRHALGIGLGAACLAIAVAVGLRLYQRHRAALGEPE